SARYSMPAMRFSPIGARRDTPIARQSPSPARWRAMRAPTTPVTPDMRAVPAAIVSLPLSRFRPFFPTAARSKAEMMPDGPEPNDGPPSGIGIAIGWVDYVAWHMLHANSRCGRHVSATRRRRTAESFNAVFRFSCAPALQGLSQHGHVFATGTPQRVHPQPEIRALAGRR